MGGNETQLWHDSVNPFQPDAGRSAAGSPRNLESSSAGGVAPVEQSSKPKKTLWGETPVHLCKILYFRVKIKPKQGWDGALVMKREAKVLLLG